MPDCDDLPAGVPVPSACRPVRVQVNGQLPVDPPGEIVHDWVRDGWAPFTPVTMTADLDQSFTASVEDGRGTLTGDLAHTGGAAPNRGSLRVAYLRAGTRWRNGEVQSVVWGPVGWNGNNAQQGHLHGVRRIGPDLWEGIMVWSSVVFGGDYRTLHCRAVRFTGSGLSQSGGDAATQDDLAAIDRQARVIGRQRVLGDVVILTFTPSGHLQHLVPGDTVNLSSIPGITGENGRPVVEIDARGRLQSTTTATGDVTFAGVNAGAITPASDQKRYVPHVLATRVRGATPEVATVEVMRWRLEDDKPDWGDPRVLRLDVTPNDVVPEIPAGPGAHGLFGGHFHGQSQGQWGEVRFRRW